jgi:hypothetical protein
MADKSDAALWEGPPPPPDAEVVARDLSCQGSLGWTLQDALQELHDEEKAEEKKEISVAAPLHFGPAVIDRIMRSFGEAVAASQQRTTGPAALLRGRLEHYNRCNNKWRLVVEGAEIRERLPLDRNRRKRRHDRPSLWQVAEENRAKRSRTSLPVSSNNPKFDLEILAYNDI